ncbi:hypothetical protein [Acinetobacter baumannii]|uniref:hypothetical protein n=1 Tax=Acinetobacter baumannii TaxID=470 RepID=UPI003AB26E3D
MPDEPRLARATAFVKAQKISALDEPWIAGYAYSGYHAFCKKYRAEKAAQDP